MPNIWNRCIAFCRIFPMSHTISSHSFSHFHRAAPEKRKHKCPYLPCLNRLHADSNAHIQIHFISLATHECRYNISKGCVWRASRTARAERNNSVRRFRSEEQLRLFYSSVKCRVERIVIICVCISVKQNREWLFCYELLQLNKNNCIQM